MGAADLLRIQERFSYIILCYALDSQKSFQDLEEWLTHINANPRGQMTPITLVGTKSDLERRVNEQAPYELSNQLNSEHENRCRIVRETSAF